jgi:hypothetical protein
VIAFAVVFAIAALIVPPTHFSDLPSYVNKGWIQSHYGLNPYVHPVADIPGWQHDPMLTAKWIYNPCPYGFAFALLSRGVTALGRGNFALTVALFKLTNLAAYAAITWLVVVASRRLSGAGDSEAVYLFLWNPLVVIDVLANAHNDIVMALCTTLAFFAASCEFWVLVLPLLVAGTLVKYSPAIMIPFAVIEMYRRGRVSSIVYGVIISIAIFGLAGAPYLPELRSFRGHDAMNNLFVTANSLQSVFLYSYEAVTKAVPSLRPTLPAVDRALLVLIWTAGLIVVGLQLWRFWRRAEASMQEFITNALFAQFLIVCVLSSKFYSWYVTGIYPVALLLEPNNWLRKLVILLTLTETLAFTPLGQAHILNYLVMVAMPIWIIYRGWAREYKIESVLPNPAGRYGAAI